MNFKVERSGRKTISIIIRDGAVLVRAPHHVTLSTIQTFVDSKRSWITRKLSQYQKLGPDFNEVMSLRVFGTVMAVTIVEGLKFSVSESDECLSIIKPQSMGMDRVHELVDLYYKEKLTVILHDAVDYYAKALKIKTPPFIVRRYKRLYGRCSSRGDLGFNVYLYHDSVEFIRYVVLHECAHILEFNHSPRFYKIIENHMPDYKKIIASNKSLSNLHLDL